MTKGEIDRLGNEIRLEYENISEIALLKLQDYRIAHKESLSEIFNILCSLNKNKKNIITYRIKRFESIIGKLYRYPKMNLSRMWDIAGCRIIVDSNDDVYSFKRRIENNSQIIIKKEYDYIKNPQEEGYKSLHLFLQVPDKDFVVELQIRNRNDHNWATLVEITDLLFNSKLKEYGDNEDLFVFHQLLSRRFELNIEEKIKIASIIKKYKYLDKLTDVFSRNYVQVRKQWVDLEDSKRYNYFLIETSAESIPKIKSFNKFEEAEKEYLDLYKNNTNANIVLTYLPNPKYHQISIAYSNYILTYHSFMNDCYDILEDLTLNCLKNRRYLGYFKYFNLYNSILFNNIRSLANEIREAKIYLKKIMLIEKVLK